jgi:hypothetical protein
VPGQGPCLVTSPSCGGSRAAGRPRGSGDARSDVDLLVVTRFTGSRRELALAMDRALRGFGLARDVVVLSPAEYERDRRIPGTIARPASLEGRVLHEAA